MSAIPTATAVSESAVIDASLTQVWHFIKLQVGAYAPGNL